MTYESSRSNRTDGDRRRRRGGSVRGARRERLEHRGNRQPVRDCRRGFGELDRRPHVPEHAEHDREPYRDRVAGALAIAGPTSDPAARAGGREAPPVPLFSTTWSAKARGGSPALFSDPWWLCPIPGGSGPAPRRNDLRR